MRLAITALFLAVAAHAAGIESFSPQGEVKQVRQATARFSDEMVPLGDPRLPQPFDIDCPEKGSGHWIDGRNWVFDFERDLPAGVQCSFRTRPDLKTLAGTPLPAEQHRFTTGGPAVLSTWPGEGTEDIDENQVFILGLDAPVNPASLRNRVSCVVEGLGEEVPARPVSAKIRKKVLADAQGFFRDYAYALNLNLVRLFPLRLPGGSTRDKLLAGANAPDAPIVVLQCARRLPAGAKVNLVWGSGIESTSGVATSNTQNLAYQVRPAFSAKFSCEKTNARSNCLPILPMTLEFTAPVPVKQAAVIRLSGAGKAWIPEIGKDDLKIGTTQTLTFKPPFPESADLLVSLPSSLRDDAGRLLVNAKKFPLKIRTDEAPPLAKFAAGMGIYELNANPMLPLTLRSTGDITQGHALLTGERLVTQKPLETIAWLRRIRDFEKDDWSNDPETDKSIVSHYGAEDSIFGPQHKIQTFPLPKPLPDKETEVIGIPIKEAGFHVVEVASPRLGESLMDKARPYHVRAAALVTNMSVHFKLGRESSLVWVTALDSGKPVANADVAVRDCAGTIYAQGKTATDGTLRIDKALPDTNSLPGCLDRWDRQYYVTAYLNGDFSFDLSDWNAGIASWRFNLYHNPWGQGPYVAHAVMDRTLFRAGETVGMKVFVRKKTANGFGFVDKGSVKDEIVLRHEGTGEETKLPVQWDAQGTAETSFTLPKEAKQGRYSVSVMYYPRGRNWEALNAGEFRVAAYRVPTMRASLSGPATPAVNTDHIKLDAQLSYLSGGAAGFAPVKLRGQLMDKAVSFGDYEDWIFANGTVKPGRDNEDMDWTIGNYAVDGDDDSTNSENPPASGLKAIRTQSLKLDAGGAARFDIAGLPKSELPQDLLAELEYRDANGETLTTAARIPLYPSAVLLAVKPDSWLLSKDGLKFIVQAVDTRGKPVRGVAIQTEILKQDWYGYRKRLLGGFYAYASGQEISKVADGCSGKTDDLGRFTCEMKAPATGELILQARAKDSNGNPTAAHASTWVPGADDWLQASDNDRMDLVPEKRKYDIGETAKLRMALPFESATVLVSVEREGVLDAWVTQVRRDAPVIEVPIKSYYGPNVFVTALAVRGRIADIAPTAMVDLGKPAYRMGATELKTGWSGHALDVKVTTDKPVYAIREQVKAKIRATRPDGSPAKNGEVAVAVVDEGLLELQANDSWKLLDAMMTRRGIEVETSTAQMQVVGKRHYGRKAVPSGGGGGRQSARELFDTRVYWQARVKLDGKGEAEVSFPLNDSLTSFRVVAVANVNVGRFGTGSTSIQTRQDLILQSGLAPVVRAGDSYSAYITVRNGSEHAMTVQVDAKVSGIPDPKAQSVSLNAGEARELSFPVQVPSGVDKLVWDVSAHEAGKGEAIDRFKLTQRVIEAVPVRTYQATLAQLDQSLSMMTKMPDDAVPGRGGIGVKFQAKLGSDLPGVVEYMSHYPWSCLEQQTSRAIALQDETWWNNIATSLPLYLDRDGLAKYWTDMREGSDTLTAYVLSIADEAGYTIPDSTRARMIKGLADFVEGRVVRGSVLNTADLAVRKIAAMEALSRYAEANFQSAWLDSFEHNPNLWPTTTLLDWIAIHERIASLPDREARLHEAWNILRSRLNFSGTTMTFSTERNDAWWWLMWNGDVNANRLLLLANDDPAWQGDIGRLVRGTLSRQNKGRWHTTVANAWGVLAMKKFSAVHESVPVAGSTTAELAGERFSTDWKTEEATGLLPWGTQTARLDITHNGSGKPWVTVSSLAAIPLKDALSAGYRITRSITPIEVQSKNGWHRGDVYRVRLDIDAQTDMGWVAVSDPIPSGATILGTGLGKDSAILSGGEKRQGWVWPAYEERTFDSFRAYYTWVPKGQFTVEYTVRLNNDGDFQLPAARVEAMYAPELFGETPAPEMVVKP